MADGGGLKCQYYMSTINTSVVLRGKVSKITSVNKLGHNQIWLYDDVTHICKMAPTTRNTREGHFLALCCA